MNRPECWTPTPVQVTIGSVHELLARRDAAYAPTVDNFSEPREAGGSSREWRPAPGELVSLWDMLRVNAGVFTLLMTVLRGVRKNLRRMTELEARSSRISTEDAPEIKGEVAAHDEENLALRNDLLKDTGNLLGGMVETCTSLELSASLAQIETLRGLLTPSSKLKKLAAGIREFESRVQDELQARMFWFVPSKWERYALEECPFGKQVADRFPKQAEDIEEAAKCMCFGRYTGAVFHLMRAMERAVHFFARKLGIRGWTIEEKEWGKILVQIDGALDAEDARIQAMSSAAGPRIPANRQAWVRVKKAKRKLAAHRETAAYLHHVKSAWRNDTMHPKRTYTQDQGEEVFKNVRSFLRSLAGAKDADD